MVAAFPSETTARYLIRDRDRIHGVDFHRRVAALGLNEVPTAPRSPWQSGYAERFMDLYAASASTTPSCSTSDICTGSS